MQFDREDKNLKPFSVIDSYNETRRKFMDGLKSNSVDTLEKKLKHNNEEKKKYISFFNTIKKKKIDSVISEVTKWNEKIYKMPRIRVQPRLNRNGNEEDHEPFSEERVEQTNLMTNPTSYTNDLVAKIISQNKNSANKYSDTISIIDVGKITVRWLVPSSLGDMPSYAESREGGAMVSVNGKLWIFGGYNNSPVRGIMCYDTSTNKYFKPPLLDEGELGLRFNHSMVLYRDQIIIFGGETVGVSSLFSSKMTSNTIKIIDTSKIV